MIEAARTRNREEPADDFLRTLERYKSPRKLSRLANVLVRFEDFARTGNLAIPHELNELCGGIWEIKAGETIRLPFYYTHCGGKRSIRLTSGFIKGTPKTPRKEIDRALWVMKEDQGP